MIGVVKVLLIEIDEGQYRPGVVKISPHINAHTLNYCLVFVPALWFQVSAPPLAAEATSLIEKETVIVHGIWNL